jgi:integrase
MFSWGIRRGCYGIEMNPCIDSHQIEPDAMPSAAKTRMLSEGEIVKIWQGVDADSDYGKIIPLLILTAARRSEIGNMRWSELDDVERPTKLTIPLARLKNRSARVKAGLGALVIPISPLAAGIITSVVPRAGCDSLFGGWRDTGYKNWDDDKKDLDAKIKIAPWTTHHLRRAISTMLGHLGVWPHVVDALTGHVTGKQEPRTAVSVVYNRSPYAAEVKAALTMWSDHVAEVVARDPTLFNERTHQWKLDA